MARMLDRLGVLKALEPASVFPEALIFATLKNTIHYPFVDIHKPYITIDIGYFIDGAGAASVTKH